MKVFDENHNPVGYVQEDNGKLVMIGAAEAGENSGIKGNAYTYHTKWFLAREFADWFFAGAVITLVGMLFLVMTNGNTADLDTLILILPNYVLLMAPVTFALRLVATFFGTLLDVRFAYIFLIQLAQILVVGIGYALDLETVGTFAVGILDVMLLYCVRKILKEYLSILPKNVKKENVLESKSGFVFILLLMIVILVSLSVLLNGGWGDNEFTVFIIVFLSSYRGAEVVQFFRVGNLIRKANL